MSWEKFNREQGAKVGMRIGGKLVTLAMMRDEPLFATAKLGTTYVAPEANRAIKDTVMTATKEIAEVTDQLQAADTELVKASETLRRTADTLSTSLKNKASSIKDYAERVHQSLHKFHGAINSEQLAADVSNLERFVIALDRLAEIEASGKLSHIISALTGK